MAAARVFVSQLQVVADEFGSHDQVAIVGFNDRAWTATELTSDRETLDNALDGLLAEIREGTRLDLAFAEGLAVLTGPSRRAENTPALVLLTDGLPNRVPTPEPFGGQEDTVLAEAARAKDAGVLVYTIGLGQPGDVREWMLADAASEPSMYYHAPDGEDLAEIYRRILKRLVCDDE
jgi:Mg-chelatase subunit ChlD